MTIEEENEPVLLAIDANGYLIAAGKPDTFKSKELGALAKDGCTIKTVPFKEYVNGDYKWIYNNEN